MRKLCTACLVIVGLSAGVVLALAYRSSRDTGTGFLQCLKAMPADARTYVEDLRGRAQQAVVSGRQAAAEKVTEIETVLTGDMRAPDPSGARSNT
jgi:hypothetical protein